MEEIDGNYKNVSAFNKIAVLAGQQY